MDRTYVAQSTLRDDPVNFFVSRNDVIVSCFSDGGNDYFNYLIGTIFEFSSQENAIDLSGIESAGLALELPKIELINNQSHLQSTARRVRSLYHNLPRASIVITFRPMKPFPKIEAFNIMV